MSEFYRNYLAVAVFAGAALLMVGGMLALGLVYAWRKGVLRWA